MADLITIDGFGPMPVLKPHSVAEAGELVRKAVAENRAIYPVGGRTALGYGLPPTKPGFALDTRGLNRLIDYPTADMTVTVQAGMTVASLQSTLAQERQWLPVDLAMPAEATLGGAVAVNASGPRRFGYGTLRDYLIGISFLTDAGEEVKGGGRVVKNVAGYDLMKLHLGALGTLGVITQLTFKVKPVPEERAVVTFGVSSGQLAATLDALHATNGRPVAVDLLNAAAAIAIGVTAEAPWTLVVGLEEKAITVTAQIEIITKDVGGKVNVLRGTSAGELWPRLTALPCRAESKFVRKASVLPSQVAAVVTAHEKTFDLIHAHALTGVVWFHSDEDRIPNVPGTLVCRTAPAEWKTPERVWGKPAGDSALKAHIKRTLDPHDVFNAGRGFRNA